MSKLILMPVVEQIEGGWQARGHLHDGNPNLVVASERFNAYNDKFEAWEDAVQSSKDFAKNHNSTCKCGKKMVVGSY